MMMARLYPLLGLFALAGCPHFEPNGDFGCPEADLTGTKPPDMTSQPNCAAAKGLAGDNLLCVDFSDSQITVPGLTGQGWFFEMDANCPGWEIMNGQLQVANFSSFMGTCQIKLPALSASEYQKYNSFTLSIVHSVDLNTTKQGAYVYLGLAISAQQLWYTTGTYPPQISVTTYTKTDLPNGGNNNYQPLFQIASNTQVGTANNGWQIQSIAVNASQ
jgi:hypothetical protein